MIKLVFRPRRPPTLTAPQFHRYWLENHAELVRRHASTSRIRRDVQNHTFSEVGFDPVIAPGLRRDLTSVGPERARW